MNRAQALREIELLENYEFDRGDAPVRLQAHLSDTDPEIVLAALRASTHYFGLPGVWEKVFDLATRNRDEEIRAASNAALWPVIQEGAAYDWKGEVEEEEELDEDAEFEFHPMPVVPREVYEATRNHLLSHVDAPMESMDVRRRCLESLGHLSFLPEIKSIILRFYNDAPNEWVKISALFAMGLHPDEDFERILLEELGSSQPQVMVEAMHSVANLGLESAWTIVEGLMDHPNKDVRFEAYASAGLLAPLGEAAAIIQALERQHPQREWKDAFEIARQSLEQRLAEEGANDGWRMDQVWDEIDRMTQSGTDEDEDLPRGGRTRR